MTAPASLLINFTNELNKHLLQANTLHHGYADLFSHPRTALAVCQDNGPLLYHNMQSEAVYDLHACYGTAEGRCAGRLQVQFVDVQISFRFSGGVLLEAQEQRRLPYNT